MRTIIGSSWRECVLIILFQLYGSKGGFFECNLCEVGQYDSPTFILEEETLLYLSYFEAGMSVWDSKFRPPNSQKHKKYISSKWLFIY